MSCSGTFGGHGGAAPRRRAEIAAQEIGPVAVESGTLWRAGAGSGFHERPERFDRTGDSLYGSLLASGTEPITAPEAARRGVRLQARPPALLRVADRARSSGRQVAAKAEVLEVVEDFGPPRGLDELAPGSALRGIPAPASSHLTPNALRAAIVTQCA